MKTYSVKKIDFPVTERLQTAAKESDCGQLIKGEAYITDEQGKPLILVKKLTKDCSSLKWAVSKLKYPLDTRMRGLKTTSAIIGYRPRNVLRFDFCGAARAAYTHTKEHGIITSYAAEVNALYKEYFPDVYERHAELIKEVLPEWRLPDSLFTSGIVNKNNELKYHYDKGNFNNVVSNMVVFKHKVQGGYLNCPEYGISIECPDSSIVMFNGQEILHGVTPIKYLTKQAVRYSIVYYALKQMCNCLPIEEELKRVRVVKKHREEKRVACTDSQ